MRKAGLKSRNRRTRPANGNGGPSASYGAAPNYGASQEGGGQGVIGERRKPTAEEAALTAKNYRLAKELSDLRVRHRDETRVVTRLTMENMNLASRCREAISHVAMLKKELAMQQRRTQEMMSLRMQQPQQPQQPQQEMSMVKSSPALSCFPDAQPESAMAASPAAIPSSPALDINNRMSLTPASNQLAKQSNQQSLVNPSTPQDQLTPMVRLSSAEKYREFDMAFDDTEVDDPELSSIPQESSLRRETKPKGIQSAQHNSRSTSSEDKFDATNSLGLARKLNKNISISTTRKFDAPDDAPADEMLLDDEVSGFNSSDFFAHSKAPSLPTTPEKGGLDNGLESAFSALHFKTDPPSRAGKKKEGRDSDDGMPESPALSSPGILNQNRKSISSSIDAFEASFNTTFPSTFSTTTEESPPSLDMAFDVPEFSDPFFLGSVDGGGASSSTTFHETSRGSTSVGNSEISMNNKTAASNTTDLSTFGTSEILQPNQSSKALDKSLGTIPNNDWNGADSKNQSLTSLKLDTPGKKTKQGLSSLVNESPSPSSLFPASAMSTFEMMSEQSLYHTPGRSTGQKQYIDGPGDELFHTPPSSVPVASNSDTSKGPSPQRPEKMASSSVRARYDAALSINNSRSKSDQQKNQPPNPKTTGSEGSKIETSHSPTLVLRRLQQRRTKEKTNNVEESSGDPPPESSLVRRAVISSSKGVSKENNGLSENSVGRRFEGRLMDENTSSSNETKEKRILTIKGSSSKASSFQKSPVGKIFSNQQANSGSPFRRSGVSRIGNTMTPDIMHAEIRQLDAIANASSTSASSAPADTSSGFSSTFSKRRNIKHPVSYTEPSLNSKLRRGDVYFPKVEAKASPARRNRENDGQLGSMQMPTAESHPLGPVDAVNHESKNSEEVLKDLVASCNTSTPVYS